MTAEREGLAEIAGVLAATLTNEVSAFVVVRSEHDPGCPGGGDYCGTHCPVPVQDWGEPDELARLLADALADLLAARDRQVRAEAVRDLADDSVWDYETHDVRRSGVRAWLKTMADRIEAGA